MTKNKNQSGSGSKRADHKLLLVLILLVNAAVIIIHWPAISSKTILFDDDQYLTDNVLVQNPGLTSAKRFLTEVLTPSTVAGYYQPLTMISLMVDYAIGGRVYDLMPFHRTSLALHAANTSLMIILLYLLFNRAWIAAGVGLLFGLHPMTIETICWIGERKTLLAAFFTLCSLILYVNFVRKRNLIVYTCCLALYVLAIMAKPTALPLPLLMLLMDFWPLKRLNWQTVLEKIPFLAIGAMFAAITYISQENTAAVITPTEQGLKHIFLVLCHNIIFYLYKIVWPTNLSSHYPFPNPLSLSSPMVLAGVIGTCVLIPLLLISLRWTRALATGWLFFFVAIFPTIGVVGFTNVIASDKYAYLPSLGLLMILTYFLSKIHFNKKSSAYSIVFMIIILLLAATESVATRRHLRLWRNTKTIYQYMLTLAPDSLPLQMAIGCEFLPQEKIDEAICHYNEILKKKPYHARTYNNLGLLYKSQGNLEQAIAHFQKAILFKPSLFEAYNNLGNVFAMQQKLDKAIECYHQSLNINPKYAQALYNLATALKSQGKFDQAIVQYRQLLTLEPNDADVYYNLGVIFQSQGDNNQALRYYLKTVEIKPDHFRAQNNIGSIFMMTGKLDLASDHFQKALALQPNYPTALNGLAKIMATHPQPQKRNIPRAISLAQQAAQLTKYQDIQILDTLFTAYSAAGQTDNVLSTLQTMLKLASDNGQWTDYVRKQLKIYENKNH